MNALEKPDQGEFSSRRELLGEPKTSHYKPYSTQFFRKPRDLPPFTFRTIEAMLLDPTVRLGLSARLAPIMGAEFCYKQNDEWVPGIMANSPVVAAFVMRQLKKVWSQIHVLASNQIWGWAAAEVTFELRDTRTVEIDELLPRAASDCKLLTEDSKPVGVRFERIGQANNGNADVRFPRAIFAAYQPDPGMWYGSSALLGAYSPWADKCFDGGAVDVRRLFMHKDAYGGMDVAYPEGRFYEVEGKGTVTSRDIADEIVQQALAGSVTVRPSGSDQNGKPLWEVNRATTPGNPAHILQYPKDLDIEILRGLEVPDDILTAESSGAWAGKAVIMAAFYASLDKWLAELIKSIDVAIKKIVELNFGPKAWYQIETKPLAEQMQEQQARLTWANGGRYRGQDQGGAGEQYSQQPGQQLRVYPGQQNQQQQPQPNQQVRKMSADSHVSSNEVIQAVGAGVISAAELVKAARLLMSLDGINDEPQLSKFSSTQFNLPHELASIVTEMGNRIHVDDLASDGVETNPHVTVKYGLHTNAPEDVRNAVQGKPPVAITFGTTSVFKSDEHDVVKIEIESNELRSLNKALTDSLPNTTTHPQYKPHVTIAYVKPGLGERYAERLRDLQGKVAVFDRLIFSDRSRNHHSIFLTGQSTRFSLDDSGHEHAPAGSGKGGQFVSKGSDGNESGISGKQLLKEQFKKQMKESHNPSQKRAKKGGELGPNNEWYEGGAWIATTDMPKKVKKKIKDASIRKVVIEPGKYGIPEPGKISILGAIGGTYFNHRDGKINYQFLDYQRAGNDLRKQVEEAAKKYNEGERFVDIEQFYELSKFDDIARLMEAEKPLPGVLVPKAKSIFGVDFDKYKPNQKKNEDKQDKPESERLSLDDSGHEHAPAGSPGGGQFVSKSGSSSSTNSTSKSDSSKSTSDKSNKLESATKKRQVRQAMTSQLPEIKKDSENLSVDQWADIANRVWSFDPEEQLDVERSHVDDLVQIMFNEPGKNSDYTDSLIEKISDLSEDDNEVHDLAESAVDNALAKAAQSQAERWAKNLQVDQSTKEQIDEIGRRHFERGGDVESFKTMVGDLLKVDPKRPWLALYANYLDLQDYDSQVETMSLQRAKMELHWKLSSLR